MHPLHPRNKREFLAQTIAEAFNDQGRIRLYLNCCKKYPLHVVIRAYAETKSMPAERIRKSRVALFFYLLKRYDHEYREDTRH